MTVAALPLTEVQWRRTVREAASALGWRAGWTWLSIHSPSGFPDLVLVSAARKRVIWAELKTEKGKVSEKQQRWLDELRAAGQEAYVWRPSDWPEVQEVLR